MINPTNNLRKLFLLSIFFIVFFIVPQISFAQVVPEVIETIPECECYEIGSAETSQPANSTLYYSNDDQSTWTYIPVDGGDGLDCNITDVRITHDDIPGSDSEDLQAEFIGVKTSTMDISEGGGKMSIESFGVPITKTFGGIDDDRGREIAVDNSGNIIITGDFYNTVNFDNTGGTDNHTSSGSTDVFITKYNADGSYGWTRTFGGASQEQSMSVAVDSSGSIFVTGHFFGTFDFDATSGTDVHTIVGSNDIFITKYNADGSYGWTKTIGSSDIDMGRDISIDSLDNIIIVGSFSSTANFNTSGGTDNHIPNGSADVFITKINADESYGWTRTFGGTSNDIVYGVSLDNSGNVFATGSFYNIAGNIDFDGTAGVDDHTSVGSFDIFLSKYNADGSYGWTKTFGGIDRDFGQAVDIDNSGNVFLTGYFNSISADFDATTGIDTHSSDGGYDFFITKYNADGSYGWTQSIGGTGNDYGYGISLDSSGNIFVTGYFYATVNFDKTGGTDEYTSNGTTDIFITRYNADGSYGWTRAFGGLWADLGNDIFVDSLDDIAVVGYFNNTVNFDTSGGTDNHSSNGGYDSFITKYSNDGSYFKIDNYYSSGTYQTLIDSSPNLVTWETLSITQTVPASTTLQYEVLDSTCTTTLISLTTNTSIDLSGISNTDTSLCLVSSFSTTDDQETPLLDAWSASYFTPTANTDSNLAHTTGANAACFPTDISLTADTIDENSPIATVVGALSTTDINPLDTHTYSFTCSASGADDASFQLSGSSLQSNEIFDFETKSSYDICIRTDDGTSGTFDKNFTITVNDINEALTPAPALAPIGTPELSIDLYDIKNIEKTSLDLRVEVENYGDKDLTFKVKVTNKDTRRDYELKLDERLSGNGKATLAIEDLLPGTEYSFKVKVKEDDDYTSWSNKKSATTLAEEPLTSFIYEIPEVTTVKKETQSTEDLFEENKEEEKVLAPTSPGATSQEALRETNKNKEPIIEENSIQNLVLENPVITSTTIATGLIAGAAAAGAASTATIPFMPLAPGFLRKRLSEALGLAHMIASSKKRFGIPTDRSKKEKYWGVVFDSYTKQPIEEVLVQLLDKEKRRVVDQTVTDESGRYGFLIAEDKEYELKIQKGAYEIDTKNTNDDLYGKIYTNPQIFKKETPIQLNIALDSKNFNWEKFARKMINQYTSLWAKLVKYTLDLVYIAGFGISVFAVIKYPSILNYIILASYGVFLVIRIIFKNRKQFGTIISKDTNKPLPFTVVELYNQNNQRVNFTVSDILGRYYLLATDGNYKLKIKSMKTIDSPIEGEDTINVKDGILREDFVV